MLGAVADPHDWLGWPGVPVLPAKATRAPPSISAVETVIDGGTGLLYDEPTVECFLNAVSRLSAARWDVGAIQGRARNFDTARFTERLEGAMARAMHRESSVVH